MNLDDIRLRAEAWTREPHDSATRDAVQAMLDDADTSSLEEAFHQDLAFGTGGMRGIMGPGTNRMNAAVVASRLVTKNTDDNSIEGRRDVDV